ncbi:nuclear transport factor 2 family protein [Micromonosporaceae bacterium B7E4]
MTLPTVAVGVGSAADLHARIQQFYTRQMRLLDAGAAQEWADTFGDDGVFEQNVDARPLRGRAAIGAAAQRRIDALAADGMVRRHWLGMLQVHPSTDGTVRTRYYAFAMATRSDGRCPIYASTQAEDVLIPVADGWRVSHRTVRHDGVA